MNKEHIAVGILNSLNYLCFMTQEWRKHPVLSPAGALHVLCAEGRDLP